MNKNKIIYLSLILASIMFIAIGCTTNQDNLDRTQTRLGRYDDYNNTRENNNYNGMDSNRNLTNLNDNLLENENNMTNYNNDYDNKASLAKKISNEIKKIQGIDDAYVLLNENNAIVGINIDDNIKGSTTNTLKQKVEKIVKNMDENIENVNVTSNPDMLTRIKNMFEDMDSGNPIEGFTDEFKEIFQRITPE